MRIPTSIPKHATTGSRSAATIPECRRPVVDSVEIVTNTPVNNVPEPIPERLRDAVWRAEDTGDPTVLAALSPEDYETAVRYLKGIQANLAQVLDSPGTTRRP